MIIDLERVFSDEKISEDEVVVFRDVAGEEGHVSCRVEATVRKGGETFYVHVDVNGSFSTGCHRCLESTQCSVTSSFDLVVQKADPRSGPDRASTGEDFVRLTLGERRLSLDERIYESVLVNVPMQIFCKDDCKGLCSGCGVNLNLESCTCSVVPDSRWNELKQIKE